MRKMGSTDFGRFRSMLNARVRDTIKIEIIKGKLKQKMWDGLPYDIKIDSEFKRKGS